MSNNDSPIDFSMVLASGVHDMKNSVGMLLASLESVIADTPPTNDVQARRFTTLHYEASRINSELIQLLTIYRMQDNHLPVHIDEHYLIDVLEDQVARNHMLIETGALQLQFNCEDDLRWYFDADLIGSVVHNVFVNSTRYTKTTIAVGAELVDDLLCITIADDGPGYPEDMLRRPAGLIDEGDVSKGETHLGLYFAERIAAFHKQNNRVGYIELANGGELGGGVFKLFLP